MDEVPCLHVLDVSSRAGNVRQRRCRQRSCSIRQDRLQISRRYRRRISTCEDDRCVVIDLERQVGPIVAGRDGDQVRHVTSHRGNGCGSNQPISHAGNCDEIISGKCGIVCQGHVIVRVREIKVGSVIQHRLHIGIETSDFCRGFSVNLQAGLTLKGDEIGRRDTLNLERDRDAVAVSGRQAIHAIHHIRQVRCTQSGGDRPSAVVAIDIVQLRDARRSVINNDVDILTIQIETSTCHRGLRRRSCPSQLSDFRGCHLNRGRRIDGVELSRI